MASAARHSISSPTNRPFFMLIFFKSSIPIIRKKPGRSSSKICSASAFNPSKSKAPVRASTLLDHLESVIRPMSQKKSASLPPRIFPLQEIQTTSPFFFRSLYSKSWVVFLPLISWLTSSFNISKSVGYTIEYQSSAEQQLSASKGRSYCSGMSPKTFSLPV